MKARQEGELKLQAYRWAWGVRIGLCVAGSAPDQAVGSGVLGLLVPLGAPPMAGDEMCIVRVRFGY